MNTRFYLDLETGSHHIYQHGVYEHEVEDVMRRPGEDLQGVMAQGLPSVKLETGDFYE